jgi:hypothetical protein
LSSCLVSGTRALLPCGLVAVPPLERIQCTDLIVLSWGLDRSLRGSIKQADIRAPGRASARGDRGRAGERECRRRGLPGIVALGRSRKSRGAGVPAMRPSPRSSWTPAWTECRPGLAWMTPPEPSLIPAWTECRPGPGYVGLG